MSTRASDQNSRNRPLPAAPRVTPKRAPSLPPAVPSPAKGLRSTPPTPTPTPIRLQPSRPQVLLRPLNPNRNHCPNLPKGSRRAFTLIETLMGLVLAGILMAGIALALRTSLDASQRIRERSDAHAEARGALELLSQDLASAYLSGLNTEDTFFVATPADQTPPGEPFLRFTTLAHREGRFLEDSEASPRSDALLVEYSLEPDTTREDGGENLIRRERWLTETGEGAPEIVATGLLGLRFGYGEAGAFEETWEAGPETSPELTSYEDEGAPPAPSQRELPRAVEVTLMLPPPSGQESEKSPRAYRTTVLIQANGTAPFETKVVPRPPR